MTAPPHRPPFSSRVCMTPIMPPSLRWSRYSRIWVFIRFILRLANDQGNRHQVNRTIPVSMQQAAISALPNSPNRGLAAQNRSCKPVCDGLWHPTNRLLMPTFWGQRLVYTYGVISLNFQDVTDAPGGLRWNSTFLSASERRRTNYPSGCFYLSRSLLLYLHSAAIVFVLGGGTHAPCPKTLSPEQLLWHLTDYGLFMCKIW